MFFLFYPSDKRKSHWNASAFLLRSGFSEAYYRAIDKCQSRKIFLYVTHTNHRIIPSQNQI